jgi:hypothetical protein
MPDFIVPKRLLCFWITIPYAEYLILLIRLIWLFGDLKGVLQGTSLEGRDKFLSAIQAILRGVDLETLNAVFQEWMIRLEKCIDGNGEYVE